MAHDAAFTLQQNIPLAPLTTLKIGGPARYFVRAESEDQVKSAFEYAREKGLDVFIIGGGSNVLISDEGFDGLVLQIGLKGISKNAQNNFVFVSVQAGEDWDMFVASCVEDDLAGVECLSGIPGFVGGTPVQNVGAYGQEVSETIVSVRCYDRTSGKIVELTNAECHFSYRTSIFNSTERDRYVVLAVTYKLVSGGEPKIVYKDIKEYFGDQRPSLQETRNAVLATRRSKSMVIDADDPNSQSAGSFFKNPIVAIEKYSKIASVSGKEVPKFAVDKAQVKIPAAWLIENAGFYKGFVLGNAGISTRHTLAIITRNGATAADVLKLKCEIQKAVADKFGIDLIPEPVFVGF